MSSEYERLNAAMDAILKADPKVGKEQSAEGMRPESGSTQD